MNISTLGLNASDTEPPPYASSIPAAAPMTFGSVPERINALEAVLTLLIVKGSVFATSEELASVQEAIRESDELSNPLGQAMDQLLDRLKIAVERHENRKSQNAQESRESLD